MTGLVPSVAPSRSDRIVTIPNLISLIRLLCVPLFLWLVFSADQLTLAAGLLAVLGATDWVDGYIARHFDQASDLGKVLDPVADRAVLIAGAVALLFEDVPVTVHILVWVILLREVLIGAVTVVLAMAGARRIDVVWAGKAGTLAIMFALPALLFAANLTGPWHTVWQWFGWLCAIGGVILGYKAAAEYVPAASAALREGRAARVVR